MPFTAQLLALPTSLLVVLCVLVFAGLAILGLILAHRFVPASVMKLHNDVAGFVFATVGVIYAVLLAFVVLVVWEQYNEANTISATEGAIARAIGRNIESFPDKEDSARMLPLLQEYSAQVVECEYPALARFEDCPSSRDALKALWREVAQLETSTSGEQAVQAELLDTLTALQEQRTLRQAQVYHQVPGAIWIAILLGAFLTVSFTFLFGAENRWAQFLITGVLAGMIGLVISTVILLDHPFTGDISVRPHDYEHVIKMEQGPSQPKRSYSR